MNKIPAISLLLSLCASSVTADVKPNGMFNDHAVLQQGIKIPVWGSAADGEKVTVSMNGQTVSTVAQNGKWEVSLAPIPAGGPYTLIIQGNNTITLNDIMVGEVWLASGQSNMERQLGPRRGQQLLTNWLEEKKNAANNNIRMITIPLKTNSQPQSDIKADWKVCDTSSVVEFSAVAYFFARDLQAKLNVPIGIIHSSWGGTPAEKWISKEAMMANDTLVQGLMKADEKRKSAYNGLYNAMIAPLIPYAIKGAIWYQGESNRTETQLYQTLFPAMINDWRSRWKIGDFPFLFVQVAPYKDMPPEIRESQLISYQRVSNTSMVVTTDCGDCKDIHPVNKQPVGYRLSLGAVQTSVKRSGNKIVLGFDHAAKGLMKNDALKGFEISAGGDAFVAAKAKVKGKTVVVWSEELKEAPVSVRYGWSNCMDVNLFNKESLPASPFRVKL
ncbi:MAG: sialate O-acetylesterase [Chitinophagaceae bacterium]|nr:sialate O-acetylesterase [Chitinophagaceae bacterium]